MEKQDNGIVREVLLRPSTDSIVHVNTAGVCKKKVVDPRGLPFGELTIEAQTK